MRVKSSIEKKCPKCQLVRRGKYLYITCKANSRHKQRQG